MSTGVAPTIRTFQVFPDVPAPLQPLTELASRWSVERGLVLIAMKDDPINAGGKGPIALCLQRPWIKRPALAGIRSE